MTAKPENVYLAGLVRGTRAEHPKWNPARVAHHLGFPRRAVEHVWGADRHLTDYRQHRDERKP